MSANDLYSILGVLPDAEDVVIVAAYRALAQRYHPDRWKGNPADAHSRMSEINGAYATLGDKARRAEYDRTRSAAGGSTFTSEATSEQENAFSDALHQLESRWQLACEIFPDLGDLRTKLARISTGLAFAFVTALLETKAFARRVELANHLQRAFLERYFGTNADVLTYARSLISDGHREAARFLNQLVDVVGSEVDPQLVIAQVENKFGLPAIRAKRHADQELTQTKRTLAHTVRTSGYYDEAARLAGLLGYKISEVGGGFMKSPEIAVAGPTGEQLQFKNSAGFIYWVQQNLCRLV